MADRKIELNLTARDQASKKVEDLAESVEDLEEHDQVDVDVDADTRTAQSNLDDVIDQAEELDRLDPKISIDAQIADAERALRDLDADLDDLEAGADDAGDAVSGVGGSNKVNAIRDLTGPLGEVSSQVGDMGESFAAAGELIEEKMGLAAGSMTGLLGPIGLVAGAGFALWQSWKADAEETKKRVQEVKESIIDLGATTAAQTKIQELLKTDPDLVTNVQALGLSYQDLVNIVSGEAVPQFERWREAMEAFRTGEWQKGPGASKQYADALGLTVKQFDALFGAAFDTTNTLGETRDEFAKGRAAADAYQQVLATGAVPAARALGVAARQAATDTAAVNKELGEVPPAKWTDIHVTDNGSAAATGREIDQATRDRTVEVELALRGAYALGQAVRSAIDQAVRSAGTTTVNVVMPRGARFDPSTRAQVNRYVRRNGGRTV